MRRGRMLAEVAEEEEWGDLSSRAAQAPKIINQLEGVRVTGACPGSDAVTGMPGRDRGAPAVPYPGREPFARDRQRTPHPTPPAALGLGPPAGR